VRLLTRVRAHGERGAVAVEFGLIAPLLILLVFGIIDFGWMYNRNTVVDNVARDAVRTASLSGSYADVESTITSELASYGIPAAKVDYSITCTNANGSNCANNAASVDGNATSGSSVQVSIEYTHDLMTPVGMVCGLFGGQCAGNQVQLSKTAEMVRE
jgi:Flp pilus assembly protein TadG